jgi:hypothetical protein
VLQTVGGTTVVARHRSKEGLLMAELKETREVTALVVDYGLFTDLAARLAREFKRVLYYVPWEASYPRMHPAHVGYGIDGLELVESPFGPWFDDVDLFIFTDLGFPHLQTWLEAQGKRVWGARSAEDLEACRETTHELLKTMGLPSPDYECVTGIRALRTLLKARSDVWVKISKWRGHFETFFVRDYSSAEPVLDEIERDMGPLGDIAMFMVEENLPDKVEAGTDGFTVDGRWPSRVLTGIEVKDRAYAGRIMDWKAIPEPIRRFDEAIAPCFAAHGYRGFYATEVRIGQDQAPYMIDFCARVGSPPSELWQEMYLNLGDIVWKGSNGIMVDPLPAAAFGCEAMIESRRPGTDWQTVCFPERVREHVKLRNVARIDGCYHLIPQNMGISDFGAVLGMGDSLDEAIREAKAIAAQISGSGVYVDTSSLDDVHAELEKLRALGMVILDDASAPAALGTSPRMAVDVV